MRSWLCNWNLQISRNSPQLTVHPDAEIIGTTVDHFLITGLLGRGGMGIVYKAEDLRLERTVAIKVMDPALTRDEAFMKRFTSEAKSLARLRNPHIVSIYALAENELGACIVMEYIKGITLGELVKTTGRLPIPRALRFFDQLLLAFEHAHKAGVIHRDVKPGNIMVTPEDDVMVMDFGLARIHRGTASTVTQITGGTLYYTSPEQLDNIASVDHRGDIYSLGMTLYEALTGIMPLADTQSDFKIRERIVRGKIPPPHTYRKDLPSQVSDFIMHAITANREKRFQSAGEMRRALGNLGYVDNDKTVVIHARRAPRKKVRFLRYVLAACGLGALLLFALKFVLPSGPVLVVRSSPDGARVEVDGEFVGMTPLPARGINPGQHHVKVSSEGFDTYDTSISPAGDDTSSLLAVLHPNLIRPVLAIQSAPKGARVLINGVDAGNTPISALQLDSGRTRIRVSLENHADRETVLVLHNGMRGEIILALEKKPKGTQGGEEIVQLKQPAAVVTVSSTPRYESFLVDGRRESTSTVDLVPGNHTLQIVSGGHIWEKEITLGEGDRRTIGIDFTKKVRVRLRVQDQDGSPINARILVDGTPYSDDQRPVVTTPAQISVAVGLHVITVSHDDFTLSGPTIRRNFGTSENEKMPEVLQFTMKRK